MVLAPIVAPNVPCDILKSMRFRQAIYLDEKSRDALRELNARARAHNFDASMSGVLRVLILRELKRQDARARRDDC